MVTMMSYVLGILSAIGVALSIWESGQRTQRTKRIKKYGIWFNLVAQIPWFIFNVIAESYGLFIINIITVVTSVLTLKKMRQPEAFCHRCGVAPAVACRGEVLCIEHVNMYAEANTGGINEQYIHPSPMEKADRPVTGTEMGDAHLTGITINLPNGTKVAAKEGKISL